MGVNDIRAGGAYVELTAQSRQLKKDLDGARGMVKRWADSIKAIENTIFVVAAAKVAMAALNIGRSLVQMGSDLVDASSRTGIAVDQLQRLNFAAEQTGTSVEELEGGIKRMQANIVGGSSAFTKLGLSLEVLRGLSPEDQFKAIAEAISKVDDPTQRAAAAMAIFGKSGTSLLPMMLGGKAALDAFGRSAEQMGLVISGEDAGRLETFGDQLGQIGSQLKALATQILSAAVPALSAMATGISNILAYTIELLKSLRELSKELTAIGKSLMSGEWALAGKIMMNGLILSIKSGMVAIVATFEQGLRNIARKWNFIARKLGLPTIDTTKIGGTSTRMMRDIRGLRESLDRQIAEANRGPGGDLKARSGSHVRRFDLESGNTSAAGTFNPFAVSSLGGTVTERIANGVAATAQGVQQLVRMADRNRLVFS